MDNYLLDTGVLILAVRRNLHVLDWLDVVRSSHRLHISVISRAEMLAGMHPREEPMTMGLLDPLITIPVNQQIADRAGRLIYEQARRGRVISLPDALIAATALEQSLTLVTTNVKHFVPLLGSQAVAPPGE